MSSHSGHIFPYAVALREGGVVETFPVVKIQFPSQKGELFSLFLVLDSGAAISALPRADAEALGIDAEKGIPQAVMGIGGNMIKGWRHRVTAYLGDKQIRFPVVFLEGDSAPRVLGRLGIFELFTVIFEERNRRSGFIEHKSREAKSIKAVLDILEKRQE